jgi:hypothetical protein
MRSLVINGATGSGENEFVHCTIGLDTILRTTSSIELQILGQSPRNVFEGCLIETNGSAATLLLGIPSAGVDRYTMFNQCLFYNYTGNGGAALTAGYSIVTPGGDILMPRCVFINAPRPANAFVWTDPEAAASAVLTAINPA